MALHACIDNLEMSVLDLKRMLKTPPKKFSYDMAREIDNLTRYINLNTWWEDGLELRIQNEFIPLMKKSLKCLNYIDLNGLLNKESSMVDHYKSSIEVRISCLQNYPKVPDDWRN